MSIQKRKNPYLRLDSQIFSQTETFYILEDVDPDDEDIIILRTMVKDLEAVNAALVAQLSRCRDSLDWYTQKKLDLGGELSTATDENAALQKQVAALRREVKAGEKRKNRPQETTTQPSSTCYTVMHSFVANYGSDGNIAENKGIYKSLEEANEAAKECFEKEYPNWPEIEDDGRADEFSSIDIGAQQRKDSSGCLFLRSTEEDGEGEVWVVKSDVQDGSAKRKKKRRDRSEDKANNDDVPETQPPLTQYDVMYHWHPWVGPQVWTRPLGPFASVKDANLEVQSVFKRLCPAKLGDVQDEGERLQFSKIDRGVQQRKEKDGCLVMRFVDEKGMGRVSAGEILKWTG